MSKARAKGTSWEVELLPLLREVFGPHVERAPLKGIQDKGDFVGVPWLHEAKKTDQPRFLLWAKTNAKKSPRWAILWSGDRRRGDGPFVMLPLDQYLDLVGRRSEYVRGSSVHTDVEGFVVEPLHQEDL
jgi:hypothetical protein